MSKNKTRTKDKYRVVYNDTQRIELENEFRLNEYIAIPRKQEIAHKLQLSERQIKIWFQNRRAKKRKQENRASSQRNVLTTQQPHHQHQHQQQQQQQLNLEVKHPFLGAQQAGLVYGSGGAQEHDSLRSSPCETTTTTIQLTGGSQSISNSAAILSGSSLCTPNTTSDSYRNQSTLDQPISANLEQVGQFITTNPNHPLNDQNSYVAYRSSSSNPDDYCQPHCESPTLTSPQTKFSSISNCEPTTNLEQPQHHHHQHQHLQQQQQQQQQQHQQQQLPHQTSHHYSTATAATTMQQQLHQHLHHHPHPHQTSQHYTTTTAAMQPHSHHPHQHPHQTNQHYTTASATMQQQLHQHLHHHPHQTSQHYTTTAAMQPHSHHPHHHHHHHQLMMEQHYAPLY